MDIKRTVTTIKHIDEENVIYLRQRTGGSKFTNGGEWTDFHICVKTYYSDELVSLTEEEFNQLLKKMDKQLIKDPEKTGNVYHLSKKFIRSFSGGKYGGSVWYGPNGKYGLEMSIDLPVYKKLKKELPKLERHDKK